MGMLIGFYAGDKARIVKAWKSGNAALPVDNSCVIANADLSFHLSEDDLDRLMSAASSLVQAPRISFAESVGKDLVRVDADSEAGIHEMTDAFTDLFATIPRERTAELYQLWRAQLPEQTAVPAGSDIKKRARKIGHYIQTALFGLIFGPVLLCAWLFSPGFRKDRARNKAKAALRTPDLPILPAYTMKEALEALIHTCRTAKSCGKKVIYIWSL
jgi:hypothetical protein